MSRLNNAKLSEHQKKKLREYLTNDDLKPIRYFNKVCDILTLRFIIMTYKLTNEESDLLNWIFLDGFTDHELMIILDKSEKEIEKSIDNVLTKMNLEHYIDLNLLFRNIQTLIMLNIADSEHKGEPTLT